jgi:hypothetical protein
MTTKQRLSRRGFLAGAGAASVAGAAALVAPQKPAKPAPVKTSKADIEPGAGYQLTEHVRNYYRSTTV